MRPSNTTDLDPLQLPTDGASYRLLKRSLDLFIAIGSLPIVLPVGLMVALLVKATSRGPVFYKHLRIGKGGHPFYLWKFRTMEHNSEQLFLGHLARNAEARQEWKRFRKLRFDPRVTKVGMFLRRTNLDELPQIINVICGEMSTVGPRPIVDEEMGLYGAGAVLYEAVLPGITGIWQVSGRGCLPFERRVALDVEYVSTWSFHRDLRVLFKTLSAVWTCRGAF
jgi:exopolysaccharide production protein ExoY